MPLTFDLRARPLYVLLLLMVCAAAAGLLALGRMHRSTGDAAASTPTKSQVRRSSNRPAAPAHPGAPKAAPAGVPPSQRLPVAIQRAFENGRVVVVALYDPKAKIDGTALLEAKAGAKLSGSAFVPIDVRRNSVEALNARYGVVQDPAVLVLSPPGDLVVRIDGFADRDTVAQAAADAGP